MFGKKATSDIKLKVEQLAVESCLLGEALETDGIHIKDFVIDYSVDKKRTDLLKSIRVNIHDLPPNSKYWAKCLESFFADAETKNSKDLRNCRIASAFILSSCIKTELVCMVANEYPKDKVISKIANSTFLNLGVSLSILFPGIKRNVIFYSPVKTSKFGDVQAPSDAAEELMDLFPNISNYSKRFSPF